MIKVLSVEGVSSGYGKLLAIHDVDINVKKGEVVVNIIWTIQKHCDYGLHGLHGDQSAVAAGRGRLR